jgi:putative spermidine/putrescine transport system ATP-binding protein
VAENVAFGLEMRRVPRSERRQRVQAALDLIHLGGLGGRYPRQLSGGQQQRVALARALVIEPTLLLLDEPMSNLDAKLREDMQIELRQLQRALGITTILVTHDQSEAMALADRIAVMNSGRIVQIDTPNRAYEQPVDHFTSTFLGKSNAFRTRVASIEDGTAWVSAGDVVFGVDAQALRGAGEGSEVTCIVRPERITVRAAGEGIIDGSVRAAIFLGNHWLLKLETQLGDVLVFLQNVGGAVPEEGALIGLDWPPASVRVLERGETDERV